MLLFTSQGLARVSHQVKLIFLTLTEHEFEKHSSKGVNAYIIDTGVNVDHTGFYGRASWGKARPFPERRR